MKTLPTALLLAVLSLPVAWAVELDGIPLLETPRPLPEITFTDEEGAPLTLDVWQDKIVLLNLWATWCAPCREEMPTLDRLQARLGSESFEVLALSFDRDGLTVAEFFDEIGIEHLRIFIDESGGALRNLEARGMPVTLLLGRDGQELGRLVGPAEWDTPVMITFFETVIANQ